MTDHTNDTNMNDDTDITEDEVRDLLEKFDAADESTFVAEYEKETITKPGVMRIGGRDVEVTPASKSGSGSAAFDPEGGDELELVRRLAERDDVDDVVWVDPDDEDDE